MGECPYGRMDGQRIVGSAKLRESPTESPSGETFYTAKSRYAMWVFSHLYDGCLWMGSSNHLSMSFQRFLPAVKRR